MLSAHAQLFLNTPTRLKTQQNFILRYWFKWIYRNLWDTDYSESTRSIAHRDLCHTPVTQRL